MKIFLGPLPDSAVGGINQVVHSLYRYLPDYGIEIVDSVDQADLIHTHIGVYDNYPVGIPLVVSSHGLLWEEDGWGTLGWKVNQHCVGSYLQADVVTAPSKFVAQAIERNTLIYPEIVRHGINPDEWLPGGSEGYVLWNKGRVDPACKIDDLMWLASQATEVPFVSTFGGSASNVSLTGRISSEEMYNYVRNAAVYLITPRESGGPSFGVLEAMSCGVPVLSWDYGGTAEAIVHKETGYLAEPGNYNELLEGLYYCLEHRSRLGAAGRNAVIKKYDVRKTIKQYVDVYEKALETKSGPKVSVVVPCYNLGKFLPACVESVQAQSFTDWELIIVDDASTDDSPALADSFASDKIKVLHNKTNKHVSASRNRGIAEARGKYILPLDADDRLFPEALALLVQELDANRHYQIVTGKLVIYPEDNMEQGWSGEWPNNTELDLQLTGYNRLSYCSMYRKKVWENIGGYRTRIRSGIEDADFWTRALSFGYAAKIIDKPILRYTHRNNSLGKQNQKGNWAWLSWFGWTHNPSIIPLGAAGKGPYSAPSFNSPVVSVVVPVGPGHKKYLQTICDSMLAQTFSNWELVLVNDTGTLWEDHIPFATVVEFNENRGVAAARNAGVVAAKADKIVFLDADDIAQPDMLAQLLSAHAQSGGWIYGDWYYTTGDKLVSETSKDWSVRDLMEQSLGPITGLYEKKHILEIRGFDETAPGWEDWDFHLGLLEIGVCGTRVAYPLITYNMHLGRRREENFDRKQDLIQYITEKHKNLYRRHNVACTKCGGKKTVSPTVATKVGEVVQPDMMTIAYVGPQSQIRTFNSKVQRGVKYRFSNRKPFQVLRGDVEWLTSIKDFKLVEEPKVVAVTQETVPLVTEAKPFTDLSALPLKPEVITLLSEEFDSVEEIATAPDVQILTIKGMGERRLKAVREAVGATLA